jgi:hypothetical protein
MLVKVQFKGSDKFYTYYSVDDLILGDIVTVQTKDGMKKVKVIEINVPGAEIQKFHGKIKTIPSGSFVEHEDTPDRYGLGEPLVNIRMEAQYATAYYIKHHGKSLFSQGREGKLYLIDKCPYVVVEDNGDRAFFRPVGKLVANLTFKPLSCYKFSDDMVEIK